MYLSIIFCRQHKFKFMYFTFNDEFHERESVYCFIKMKCQLDAYFDLLPIIREAYYFKEVINII